ncbi:hypothetical protein YC2023_106141 [Brassica napus]
MLDNSRTHTFERKEDNAGDTIWSPSVEETERNTVEADLEKRVLGSGFAKGVEMLTENTGIDQYIVSG